MSAKYGKTDLDKEEYYRGILADAMRYYPTPYTDDELDSIERQYSNYNYLHRDRIPEAEGTYQALKSYADEYINPKLRSRGVELDPLGMVNEVYRNLGHAVTIARDQQAGGVPTRFMRDIATYWPEGVVVAPHTKDVPEGTRRRAGSQGFVHNEQPTIARVLSSDRDVAPHELQHTLQNVSEQFEVRNPSSKDMSDGYANALKAVLEVVKNDESIRKALPLNMFETPNEFVASLVGREAALPENVSPREDPVLGPILNNLETARWYFRATGRQR